MSTKSAVKLTAGQKKAIVALQARQGKIVANGNGQISPLEQKKVLGLGNQALIRMEKAGIIERSLHGKRTLAIVLKAPYTTMVFEDVKLPKRVGRPPKDPHAVSAPKAPVRRRRKFNMIVPSIGEELICTGVILHPDGHAQLVVSSDHHTFVTHIESVASVEAGE